MKKIVKMPNVNPVGKFKKVDIIGYQTKPEQFKSSKDEHGSIYLLTIASAICRLLGANLYHICPIWVYPILPSICCLLYTSPSPRDNR